MPSIREEEWFKDPFHWYERVNNPRIAGMPVGGTHVLDFMQVLHDIWKSFIRNERERAIKDIEVLAVILIANAFGRGPEAIEEFFVANLTENMDDILTEILEGDNNG